MTDTLDLQQQDAETVKAVLGGAPDRYEEIVRRHERQIYAVAWSRLGNAALAEEAAQLAFIRGYTQLSQLKNGAKVGPWIGAMARNIAINLSLMHRREMDKREKWSLQQAATTGDEDEESGEACSPKILQEALAKLPTTQRECLVLFYFEGKSNLEASATLGISEATFRVKLHRARASLRKDLDQRLAGSLRELRPENSLSSAVMAGIFVAAPSTTAGGVGGTATGGGYTASKIAAGSTWLSGKALVSFGWLLPWALVYWWIGRREAANFIEQEGFRSRLYRLDKPSLLTLIITLGLLLLQGEWTQYLLHLITVNGLDTLLVYYVMSIVCWAMAIYMFRIYRNGPNLFWAIQCLSFSLNAVVSLLAGIGWLPSHSAFNLWAAIMLFQSCAYRYRPMKMDYNLFLRSSQGLLKPLVTDMDKSPSIKMTEDNLVRFARFLGSRFLTLKQERRPDGLRLFLMPVRMRHIRGIFHGIPFIKERRSFVLIHPDGSVTAMCGENDAYDIAALSQDKLPEIEMWESNVKNALQTSLGLFCEGKNTLAEQVLGELPESEILKKPVSTAPVARWRWIMGLLDFALTLLVFAIVGIKLFYFRR